VTFQAIGYLFGIWRRARRESIDFAEALRREMEDLEREAERERQMGSPST
jgi:hypothetical protein